MAPEVHGYGGTGGSSTMEAERNKKPRKRKKSRTSSSAAKSSTSSSLPGDGDGSGAGQQRRRQLTGDGQQQQQLHRGKPRVIWTPELHNKFLKAYNALGEDAVPKKILALMNVDWISRENVASHLQKHRLSLKREEQLMPGKVNQRPPLHAEACSPTPTHVPSLHPPAQAPASSLQSLHPLPPSQPPISALTMSRLQIGHGHQHLLQTPPDFCFSSSSSNATPTTSLLFHPHPCFIPTVQPIQQLFTLPLEATRPTTAIGTRRKLFDRQQVAGRDATMAQRRAAAAASGYNNLMLVRNDVVAQASQAVSMTGESTVPDAIVRYEEATETHMEHLQMAAEGEEGQGRAVKRGSAEEMAAKAGEGLVQAAEPRTADAGSSSPHGSSIHEQYWKIDDDDITDVSWDFCGIPWRKTG